MAADGQFETEMVDIKVEDTLESITTDLINETSQISESLPSMFGNSPTRELGELTEQYHKLMRGMNTVLSAVRDYESSKSQHLSPKKMRAVVSKYEKEVQNINTAKQIATKLIEGAEVSRLEKGITEAGGTPVTLQALRSFIATGVDAYLKRIEDAGLKPNYMLPKNKTALEAALFAAKLSGCAVSGEEIKHYLKVVK